MRAFSLSLNAVLVLRVIRGDRRAIRPHCRKSLIRYRYDPLLSAMTPQKMTKRPVWLRARLLLHVLVIAFVEGMGSGAVLGIVRR